jgi:myo-inositol-1(or 4)-monophosphatase
MQGVLPDRDELRSLAVSLAREAGALLLQARPTGVGSKSTPTDLVTDADRAAEELIVGRLSELRPDDSVVAEEGSLRTGRSGLRWVIDPLDGTVNFVYGMPHWCVSIGVEGPVRLGVIHDPSRDETFTDADPLTPSSRTDLEQAMIGTGFSYSSQVRARQAEVLRHVLPQVRDIRRGGSMALDLAWVACGRLDGFYEEDSHPWDVSAGIAIIQAAGGRVETYGSLVVAAGTPELFGALGAMVVPG